MADHAQTASSSTKDGTSPSKLFFDAQKTTLARSTPPHTPLPILTRSTQTVECEVGCDSQWHRATTARRNVVAAVNGKAAGGDPGLRTRKETMIPCFKTAAPSVEQTRASTCVVCMDHRKDIELLPCRHTHCCISCFRRADSHICPVCRSPVASIVKLASGVKMAIALVIPTKDRLRPTYVSPDSQEPSSHETPNVLTSRRSMPSLFPGRDGALATVTRTNSMSPFAVARQAESSTRTLTQSQDAVFRQLRETGTVGTSQAQLTQIDSGGNRRTILPVAPSARFLSLRSAHEPPAEPQRRNMVLIGHSRKLLISVAQRLTLMFPLLKSESPRAKSTVCINGQAVCLVLIECASFSTDTELVARIQRQNPNLVLLCADFFNVSSFESIVRLDIELLGYLNIACTWILVKSVSSKKTNSSNIVDNSDVEIAKNFLSQSRKCFVVSVDGPLRGAPMRHLSSYIHSCISCRTAAAPVVPENVSVKTDISLLAFPFSCFRSRNSRKPSDSRARNYTPNLTKWFTHETPSI